MADPAPTLEATRLYPSKRTSSSSTLKNAVTVHRSRFIVVMGVSGTGKSTLGTALAERLHLPFIDGDDLHPASNVAKMARGEPLTDGDRQPWLERIREVAVGQVVDQGKDQGSGSGSGPDREQERDRVRGGRRRVEGASEAGTGQMAGADAYVSSLVRGASPVRDVGVDEERSWGVIVACSALKKVYRAVLRGEGVPPSVQRQTRGSTYFVYLKGDRDVLMARMLNRQGHFMKAAMLESQLDTLESPEGEPGVVTVSVDMSTEEQVRRVVEMLGYLDR